MQRFRCATIAVLVVLVTLSTLSISSPAAAEDEASVPLVDEKVRQLMQDRNYAEAVQAIEKAAAAKDAPADYLTYLKGRALYLQQQYDEAVTTFSAVGEQFPKSPWARRARFGKALALARKGDFRNAEVIFRAEAEYLLSEDRKQQIADIYLEFADKYFKPPKEEVKPDYKKALEFYNKALEVGPKPQKRIEVELLVARCHQELGKTAEAAKLYEKFIKDHPASSLDVEARFRLGECHLVKGELKEARRTWQDLLAAHPDSPSERIAEAAYRLSRTWQIPKPNNDEELSLGIASLEAFLERFVTHKLAGRAHLDVAQSYIHRGRHEDAAESLKRFLADERYRDREELPDARNLLGRSYQLQKKFSEAVAIWREYLGKHPTHQAWSSVQAEIINTEYLMASEKYRAEEYAAARKLWSEFLVKYPLDNRHPQILYLFGQMNHRQEEWDAATTDWRRLVSKYPKDDWSSRAQYMIAATLEQKLGKLPEALEEYRKVTWGNYAGKAKQAIARMTAKHLTMATDRVFRSDETPKLKLTTRNIETVSVRAYKIDLETYFRKMHLARGVEQLDIALIDPDTTFEFKVPDYAEYQELESTVEVPLPGEVRSGVMAVTISSETLETTTLLLQSDLDVIVKSSRDEVFVFAENMLTGKPWAGVRLLISNGQEVFAEGTTGDDGVFQEAQKKLKDAKDVRVFAIAGGNVASNVIGLKGVRVDQGLSNKGYVYTDRPAYRAGGLVHLRGCIRRASDDAYTIEEGKKFAVEVFDSRNRLVWQEEVALGPFGSFHAHFVLPVTSPQGEYRVLVHDRAKQSYQGTFAVHEYKLEPIRLVIDTPRKVYYRGEEIEGTIRAEYYYGAPLAGHKIRYRFGDDPRVYDAVTDDKGEVRFKLPTREYHETQVLPLAVAIMDRDVQTAVNFFLAAQGFSIDVSTIRSVYVAGESFEVTVKTLDAEGEPAGRKLALNVLEKTTVDGEVGERLVETHELQTVEADGIARQTLTLPEGGRYVLRAEGTDRFHNPISGQRPVQISGEEDKVRLRILADKHTFKVGDTAQVRLHWREDPALALVTFQGARVLDYKLVRLAKGDNRLEIPIVAVLAPNFELAVAVMTDPRPEDKDEKGEQKPVVRFHTASSPFVVERELKVAISAKRKGDPKGPIRPGEELEVTVTTTDPQGKPVAAEVSLAMVEQSLLERFAWPVPAIEDFFRGNRRQPAVRTTSSVTFNYRPKTRAIDPELLAERDRIEIAAEEEASLARIVEGGLRMMVEPRSPEAMPGSYPAAAAREEAEEDPFADVAAGEPVAGARIMLGLEAQMPARGEQLDLARRAAGRSRRLTAGFAFDTDVKGQVAIAYSNAMAAGKPSQTGAGNQFAYGQPAFARGKYLYFGREARLGTEVYPVADLVLDELVTQKRHDITVLQADGSLQNWGFFVKGRQDPKQIEALVAELTEAGAVLLSGGASQETGYWNPAVVTGDDGKATVTFSVPERSTGWKLVAKGITTETLAGEATDEMVVKKELFGELKLPLAFTDGDKAEVTVSVHNDALEQGQIQVHLKTTIGDRSTEETKTIDVKAKGIHEASFKTELDRPEQKKDDKTPNMPEVNVEFELTVTAGEQRDVVRRAIPLKPYGIAVYATASGSATSDTTAWVEPPKGMPVRDLSLQILVGPTVERSLLDIVMGPAPWCQIEARRIASGLDTATSDLMASLGLQKLLKSTREVGGPQAQALDSRIHSTLSLLVSSQNDDGGWSWTGRGKGSDRYGTARAVWAMSLARAAAYSVPDETFDKAIGYLRNQVAATANDDYESKAILLHALAAAGKGDFTLANRLYRARPSLSSVAVAHLALAFAAMDRKSTAGELVDLLGGRNLDNPAAASETAKGSLPWSHSPAELRALYALAIQEVTPKSPKAKEAIDWLLAHRTGHRWTPDKATGPAALALCRWFAESRFEGEHYRLAVFVGDVQAKVLEIDQAADTQVIDVPTELLGEGKQRINFQITGRGRYTYQCILGGFVPADKLKSTTNRWAVRRIYEPAPLEMDGQEIPRGFSVLAGSYSTFRNPLSQLPVGRRGLVELNVWRRVPSNTPEEQLEYLVITEPIPSGTTVIEQSVTGGFERFEISPGTITFYVGSRRSIGTIHYQLHGYLPGSYRAAPTQIRNAYGRDQLVVSGPKALEVLPSGGKSSDKYRLTPQELYELGKRHFDKGDWKNAQKQLAELVDKWNLKAKVYKHAVGMLLDAHLETGPPNMVVRYFEIIKEKWPAEEIPFDKILKVGAAYHEMGEYERSYLVFRATVQSSFRRESGVAGFLESQGEFVRSVDVMSRLLAEYPPESYVAEATYDLAQGVYAKAPEAADDAKLRQAKINRVMLIRRAWSMLESFLTAYPEDPAADQAAFATANALLELETYDEAAAACDRYARRYPKSELLDSYWYMIGYCHFATSRHAAALEMCRKVAEATRVDPRSGRKQESPNKWQAIYILGQVHHSLGEAADAIREYRRVEDRFADAKEAINYFLRKAIELDEVTTVKPGEPADVELKFRNVAACDAKVYRIDLMKFSLLKRNLGGITQINLAGIRPYHEVTVKLGDGKDYHDRTHTLSLPLKEEGAYLVVCRGDNLHASGLVLLTPLAVEVQEDVASGRVRTTVKDVLEDRYLSDVHVKVIGSRNPKFISGSTDLRGVFVADGVQGASTVIAQLEPSRYAFFRGSTDLGPKAAEGPARGKQAAAGQEAAGKPPQAQPAANLNQQLLKRLQETNSAFQRIQVDRLRKMYESEEQGVKAEKAF